MADRNPHYAAASEMSDRSRVLMELRPCFEGYAGIPQEARLLFANFARLPNIRLGGLLDGGKISGRLPPSAASDASAADRLFAQTRQVVALHADMVPLGVQGMLSGGLRQFLFSGPFKRLDLLSRWGSRDELMSTIDADLFGDWLWTRLFQKGLHVEERGLLTKADFLVPRMSWQDAARLAAVSAKARPLLQLEKGRWQIFVAHTPSPYRVTGGKMIVRYHDAIPLLWPHTIGAALAHAHAHFQMLRCNVLEGASFVCDSEASRDDLLRFFPQAESRTFVIPVLSAIRLNSALPRASSLEDGAKVAEITSRCEAKIPGSPSRPALRAMNEPFVLAVSTLEPRKNYGLLMRAFGLARRAGAKLKLVVVANPGWNSQVELAELRALVENGSALHLADVPVRDLEVLYAEAHAVICPSRAEGFDLATVEAMSQGTPVLASDIPVHRSVCGDAAEYFDPYDEDELARCLLRIAALPREEGHLAELSKRGRQQAGKYRPEAIIPRWDNVLAQVLSQ